MPLGRFVYSGSGVNLIFAVGELHWAGSAVPCAAAAACAPRSIAAQRSAVQRSTFPRPQYQRVS